MKKLVWLKNVDIDKYKYSGYGIGFDREGKFSVRNEFVRNCIIFGVDVSSFVRVGNKKKDILILGEGPKLELDDITLIAEKNIQLILLKITKNCV